MFFRQTKTFWETVLESRREGELLMCIKLAWEYPDHSSIRIFYGETWVWNEFYQAMEEAKTMAEFADRPITFIHDTRETENMPEQLARHYRNWAIEMETYSYVNIIISENPNLQNMFQTFKHFAGHWGDGYLLVESMSEAQYIAVGETLEFERIS